MFNASIEVGNERYSKSELYDCLNTNGVELEINDTHDLVVPVLFTHLVFQDLQDEDRDKFEKYYMEDMTVVVCKVFDIFGDDNNKIELAKIICRGDSYGLGLESTFIGGLLHNYPVYYQEVTRQDNYKKFKKIVLEVYQTNLDRIEEHYRSNSEMLEHQRNL